MPPLLICVQVEVVLTQKRNVRRSPLVHWILPSFVKIKHVRTLLMTAIQPVEVLLRPVVLLTDLTIVLMAVVQTHLPLVPLSEIVRLIHQLDVQPLLVRLLETCARLPLSLLALVFFVQVVVVLLLSPNAQLLSHALRDTSDVATVPVERIARASNAIRGPTVIIHNTIAQVTKLVSVVLKIPKSVPKVQLVHLIVLFDVLIDLAQLRQPYANPLRSFHLPIRLVPQTHLPQLQDLVVEAMSELVQPLARSVGSSVGMKHAV
jgi:hypothetical protein